MNSYKKNTKIIKIVALFLGLISLSNHPLYGKGSDKELVIYIGQSDVLAFAQSVKRVAIANPDIADATVISPTQILVIGKGLGVTSMVVWSETESYTKYKLKIQNESSDHQVMLQVRFMEVNKTALKEFGMDFLVKGIRSGKESIDVGSFGGKVNDASDPLNLGSAVDMLFRIPSRDISTIIKALYEDNLLTLLATPNLSAISGSEASFLAGGEFPIPVVSGAAGMQTVTIAWKEFGVKLKFTPTVLDSNIINIKVDAEVSSLDFENGVTLSGFSVPSLVSRKSETTVELEEGRYLIIGGLLTSEMAKSVSKIPILGHIPVLGRLFSSRRFLNKESELLITLTPQIIESITKEEIPELKLNDEKKGGGD
jgi:pilus assembly protein CpaC